MIHTIEMVGKIEITVVLIVIIDLLDDLFEVEHFVETE